MTKSLLCLLVWFIGRNQVVEASDCARGVDPPSTQVNTTDRLSRLRAKMAELDPPLDGYIIPMDDAHQSEYVADADKRIQFISGFSGSAGRAVVLRNGTAFLQTDGRYFLQMDAELDCNWTPVKGGGRVPGISMTTEDGHVPVVGVDPTLMSYDAWRENADFMESMGVRLVEVEENLVDVVWEEVGGRPDTPNSEIFVLGMEFAGLAWQDKVTGVKRGLDKNDVLVVSALDETAWLFNLRASDIAFNPVFFAYTIIEVESGSISLYLHDFERKISSAEMQLHLNTSSSGSCGSNPSLCVRVREYSDFWEDLRNIASNNNIRVKMSPKSSYAIYLKLGSNEQQRQQTARVGVGPIPLSKACKNSVEVQGMRNSHTRDSAVLIEFLTMLEKEVKAGEYWTEITAAARLEAMRRAEKYNKGLSFESISGVGSNGAIIHYTPTEKTVKQITTDQMYLLDSGAQYLDGTTDVTRTMHYGTPTEEEREAYTRVLMGAIDLANTIFPYGTYGRDIAVIARRPLWSIGWMYAHGTGHGLGMFLSVHEGPGSIIIGYRKSRHESSLIPAMFFSDEPGYYEEGKFGVRLETIVMVEKTNTTNYNGHYLGFLPFTLVPFETHLIKYEILSANQRKWLNAYNKRCMEEVGVAILKNQRHNDEAYEWVRQRTLPIPENPVYNGSEPLTMSSILLASSLIVVWLKL